MEKLLDLYEVAECLGVSTKTIRNLLAAGAFPAPMRVGTRMRWRTSVIEAHVAKLEAEAELPLPGDDAQPRAADPMAAPAGL